MVKESEKTIEKRILTLLYARLIKAVANTEKPIENKMRQLFKKALQNSPVYKSITSGLLRGELGIPDGESKLNNIIDAWESTIKVKIKTQASNGIVNISIRGVPSNYDDVLMLPDAVQETEKRTTNAPLEWLRWMLLEGGSPVIMNYQTVLRPFGSRTGTKVMVSSRSNWSVPTLQGVAGNNFVTRAIDSIQNDIVSMIQSELFKGLK
jgi:hypothetical protein